MKNDHRLTHKLIVQVTFLALILLNLGGCHFSNHELQGKWQETRHEEIIEFYRDGRFIVVGPGKPETGSWTMTEDNRMKIEMTILGKACYFYGELAGDLLRIKAPDGEIFEYYKLNEMHSTKEMQ